MLMQLTPGRENLFSYLLDFWTRWVGNLDVYRWKKTVRYSSSASGFLGCWQRHVVLGDTFTPPPPKKMDNPIGIDLLWKCFDCSLVISHTFTNQTSSYLSYFLICYHTFSYFLNIWKYFWKKRWLAYFALSAITITVYITSAVMKPV